MYSVRSCSNTNVCFSALPIDHHAPVMTSAKNENETIKIEATISDGDDDNDVVDSKDGLQSIITSANIKSE